MNLHLDTSRAARDARQKLYQAGMVAVKTEALDELQRLARQAGKLAAEVERLRPVSVAALTVLLKIDEGSSRLPEAVEALRKALMEANR